jgi:hypothetical protein
LAWFVLQYWNGSSWYSGEFFRQMEQSYLVFYDSFITMRHGRYPYVLPAGATMIKTGNFQADN